MKKMRNIYPGGGDSEDGLFPPKITYEPEPYMEFKSKSAYLQELSRCLHNLSFTVNVISDYVKCQKIKESVWGEKEFQTQTIEDSLWRRYYCIQEFFDGLGNPSAFVDLGELLEAGKSFLPCPIIEEARVYFDAIDQIYEKNIYHIEQVDDTENKLNHKSISKKRRKELEDWAAMHCKMVIDYASLMLCGMGTPILLLSAKARAEADNNLRKLNKKEAELIVKKILEGFLGENWSTRKLQKYLLDEHKCLYSWTSISKLDAWKKWDKEHPRKKPLCLELTDLRLKSIDTKRKTYFSRDKKSANFSQDFG